MTRAALAKLSLLATVAALFTFGEGCSRGAQLTSLVLTPASATIEVGTTQAFTVAALFDDNSKAPITSGITWTSSNVSVASVSAAGVVTGVAAGTTTILASAQGLQVSAAVTITPLAVKSIAAVPATVSLAAGLTQQLAVTATMDDNSTQDVTAGSTYASSAATVATVSTGGKITAVAVGTATVTVTASGKTATVAVTVTAATIVSLAVTPNTVSILEGKTQQLTVSATYTDGVVKAPTAVTYTSGDAAKVTVSAAGLVIGVAAGGANVTVAAGGKSVVVPVTVTAKTLVSIAATPAAMTLAAGGTQQITVVGIYDNSATSTLSAGLTFSTSAAAKATVSSTGLVTGVSAGPATITVSAGSGINATVAVTVTNAVIVSLSITPSVVPAAGGKFYVGQTQALTVVGTYSDSTPAATVPSANITWTTSAAGVATVATGSALTAVSGGTATITASVATASGAVTQTLAVTVTPQTLISIAATPSAVQVGVALTSQLAITATFDGGPSAVVTSAATYSSSDATVATVSSGGLITGVKSGSANVTASYTAASVTKTAVVGVTVSANENVFFHGAFGPNANATFANFGDATPYSVAIDTSGTNDYGGFHPLKFNNPATYYSGGAIVANAPRDLSAYNALTFYAKASKAMTLPVVGFGDNAAGDSGYKTELDNVALTTSYQKYVLPLPDASKATAMTGYFWMADGINHSESIYLADIQYEKVAGTPGGAPTAAFTGAAKTFEVTGTVQINSSDLTATFSAAIAGSAAPSPLVYTNAGPKFLTYTVAPSAIATASAAGLLTGSSAGTAAVTGKLAGVNTSNTLGITVIPLLPKPTVAAPMPTLAVDKVTSLWSSVKYNGTAADRSAKVNFSEFNGNPNPFKGPYTIPTTTAKPQKFQFTPAPGHYSGLGFHTAVADEIDATALGYDTMHMDVWSPDLATPAGAQFVVGVIDFAAAGGTGFGSQGNLVLLGSGITNSDPGGAQGGWVSYDFKLADFKSHGLTATPHNIAQLLIQADKGATVYIDNLYFYGTGSGGTGGGTPPAAAPTAPTLAAANVISLFSSTYTGGTAGGDYSAKVDSYNASCFGPPGNTVTDYTIVGGTHKVKQYTLAASSFAIIETIGATGGTATGGDSAICNGGTQSGANEIDITSMIGVHFDVYSPKGTTGLNVAIVGADATGTIAGPGAAGGATPGTQYSSGNAAVAAGAWVPVDLAFSTFGPAGGPAGINKFALLKIFVADAGTYYIDNIYFFKAGGGGGTPFAPVTFDDAAKTYSFTGFGGASGSKVADPTNSLNNVGKLVKTAGAQTWGGVTIVTGANDTVGKIPFTSTAKTMSVKIYSPRAGVPINLKVEDSTNAGISAEKAVNTTMANTWETLTWDFTGTSLDLTKTYDRLSLFPDFNTSPIADETFYCDDITFVTAAPLTAPLTAAPTPSPAPANVLALYNSSGKYVNAPAPINWNPPWGGTSGYSTVTIAGTSSVVQKYTGLNYAGIDGVGGSKVDVSTYTALHVDIWTPDATKFGVKLHTPAEKAIGSLANASNPAITKGAWIGLDFPLALFTGVDLTNLSQMLWLDNADFGIAGNEAGTFFIDNIYFYKAPPTKPTTAAPTPSVAAANVIWLLNSSGTYTAGNSTQSVVSTWATSWGSPASVIDYTIVSTSSVVKEYVALQYSGVDFANVNATASGMTAIHFDVWTPTAVTQFGIKLGLGGGAQFIYPVTTVNAGAWTGVDIPLSSFTGIDLTKINEFLWVDNIVNSNEAGTFFIDNVYFHK